MGCRTYECSDVAIAHGKMKFPCFFTPICLALSDDNIKCS